MSHLGFPLEKIKGDGNDDTVIALCSPLFLASNLAALHHTRRHHHEQRGEAMEMGKNEKRKENPTGFWRGTAMTDRGVP